MIHCFQKPSVSGSFQPFPNKPWFSRVCRKSLYKTLWEKEKLLKTSNSIFIRRVFYPVRELSTIYIKLEIVVCKLFEFGRVYNLSYGKGLKLVMCCKTLTLSQTTNFGLFQTERVCRRQFQTRQTWHKVLQRGRKHSGKRRNCS